ncbi:hypothetical protein CXG81DRAFT_17471 [Caulochytrium protostelioides]|uniref:Uncharacterized protein n=1 Tax=Caulochytrium protostelioides TaxID=1555241 RepID=A0A4V1IV62_9FUNG|nr:hypothetical protein CXG81DRAFT_17471 [Caulochytrium protostelioides]|eukprot:RKP02949.1 hypothetical protein CXG81DRAFT_17471 [Caulochytrium protostelioides]
MAASSVLPVPPRGVRNRRSGPTGNLALSTAFSASRNKNKAFSPFDNPFSPNMSKSAGNSSAFLSASLPEDTLPAPVAPASSLAPPLTTTAAVGSASPIAATSSPATKADPAAVPSSGHRGRLAAAAPRLSVDAAGEFRLSIPNSTLIVAAAAAVVLVLVFAPEPAAEHRAVSAAFETHGVIGGVVAVLAAARARGVDWLRGTAPAGMPATPAEDPVDDHLAYLRQHNPLLTGDAPAEAPAAAPLDMKAAATPAEVKADAPVAAKAEEAPAAQAATTSFQAFMEKTGMWGELRAVPRRDFENELSAYLAGSSYSIEDAVVLHNIYMKIFDDGVVQELQSVEQEQELLDYYYVVLGDEYD